MNIPTSKDPGPPQPTFNLEQAKWTPVPKFHPDSETGIEGITTPDAFLWLRIDGHLLPAEVFPVADPDDPRVGRLRFIELDRNHDRAMSAAEFLVEDAMDSDSVEHVMAELELIDKQLQASGQEIPETRGTDKTVPWLGNVTASQLIGGSAMGVKGDDIAPDNFSYEPAGLTITSEPIPGHEGAYQLRIYELAEEPVAKRGILNFLTSRREKRRHGEEV